MKYKLRRGRRTRILTCPGNVGQKGRLSGQIFEGDQILNKGEAVVDQVKERIDSEFKLAIDFLTKNQYVEGLTREKKSVFLHQISPYMMVKGVLFEMGADEVLQRCTEEPNRRKVMRALHSGPSSGHLATGYEKLDTGGA